MEAGRTPLGVRGLKLHSFLFRIPPQCRTPLGVRGLKLAKKGIDIEDTESHPARGAWIETHVEDGFNQDFASHPARGAWIETFRSIAVR